MSRSAGRNPLGLTSRVGGTSWNYVSHVTTVFAVFSTALTACVLFHFYGFLAATVWGVAACVMLIAMISLTMRITAGDEGATVPAICCNLVLIALWMGSGVALFMTGNPAAMLAALSTAWTWNMHIMLASQRNKWVMPLAMAMPTASLLFFLME